MTSTNSISASSNNAVDTLVAALMGLNMSPVTANAVVTVIQAITSGEPSTQLASPPVRIPEHADEAAEAGVHADHATSDTDHATSDVIPAETPPPPANISPTLPSGNSPTTTTTTTTLVPTAVTPTTTTPVPTAVTPTTTTTPVPTTVTPTYADPVTFPPSFVSYRGFQYEIPHASAQAPFYCVTKGKRVGVLSTWEDTSPQVTGVSGSIQSRCPSIELHGVIAEEGEHSSTDPDTIFRKLINGSTRRFLDNLTLQYIGGNHSEESRRPIQDALNILQEAEDAIRASGGDSTECRQVILSLEDVLLRVFEDEDIKSAHSRWLLRYQLAPDVIIA
ncbi:hypothetical protein DEU56DRAFT_918346 [Suillus clintonianus]|uniref:uncharacterized protein n=1 Tax=Suillus clintonianus TaxID=1904413 RepID=UPI001B86662C|nr:uncharacterized protein DEU56DRAFT_918346 [Suillus clintonianus]KAG2121108.1 hypothetical protein DEU56DRAFT_918346 [Suillus clintonianus]